MKKALQVASVASMIDQFTRSNIELLQKLGYQVDVATNFNFGSTCTQERVNLCKEELSQNSVNVYNLLFDRKIFNKSNIVVYKQLKKIINENNYDIIHCHSPIGGVITRLAARKVRKKGTKVIYTAHGFHFFKGAPLLNWLIYFPVEFICSFFTDVLITINQEDYDLAKKVMKAKKIEYIPGVGIDVEKYQNVQVDKIAKRKELGIPENAMMLLSVGELNKNKNHEVIIEALNKLDNPNIYYCIAGQGELKDYLQNKIISLGLENQVRLLGYRKDISELCHVADIFCFPSLREGLGLAAIEAMASGLPIITSNVHGINDYSIQGLTGFKCGRYSVCEYAKAIQTLLLDKDLCQIQGKYNVLKSEEFSISLVLIKMESIYSSLLEITTRNEEKYESINSFS